MPDSAATPLLDVRDLQRLVPDRGRARARRRPPLALDRARRGARHRRRVRLRQDRLDDGRDAADPRPERDRRGAGAVPRARPVAGQPERDARGPRERDRDDLPGPDDGAHAGVHGRLADRGAASRAREPEQAAGARAHGRVAGGGRDLEPGAAARRLPAPVLGRHAPARDDRDGAVVQPVAADRRRADDGARRDDPGADPRR